MLTALLLSLSTAQVPTTSRATWPEYVVSGVSGLTPYGSLFLAAPERMRFLIPFTIDGRGPSAKPNLPLVGVPDDTDVESIAWLGGDRIALGTEAKIESRKEDKILFATIGPKGAKVDGSISFDYRPYHMTAEANRGVEGLCFTDGRLLASAEQVIEEGGARYTPLQSYDLREKKWAQYRVRLTSKTGKISDLSCAKVGNVRDVYAIERHYGISHLLHFTLPLLDGGGDVTPELVMDLVPLYPEKTPNFEGIARLDDGRLLLISDNDYGVIQGPTHLLIVTPPKKDEHPIKPGAFVQ